MLKNLYLKTLKVAEKKSANYFLAFISFIESSIFPIPPDVLIIPMVLANPHRAFKIAAIATISSVIGGVFGYFIGLFLWNEIGEFILNAYNLTENLRSWCRYFMLSTVFPDNGFAEFQELHSPKLLFLLLCCSFFRF